MWLSATAASNAINTIETNVTFTRGSHQMIYLNLRLLLARLSFGIFCIALPLKKYF